MNLRSNGMRCAAANVDNLLDYRMMQTQRTAWVNAVAIVLLVAVCFAAWGIELRNLMRDYVMPAVRGQRGFIFDFQFFYEGAQRFLTDPLLLYRVNSDAGFLLIEWNRRIDYGYPPPAVLFFVPFALITLPWSYALFMVVSLLLVPVCIWLLGLLREWEGQCEKAPRGFGWLALSFGLSCGMTYVTLAFGQVNVWVLLLCLLYIACVMDGRYLTAGLVLGISFWLKFYPIFLLTLAPFEKKPIRLLLSGLLGILLIPAALQVVLPLDLYIEYFRDIYPGLAGQTSPHVYNQSIVAWLTRLHVRREMFFDWGPLVVDPSVRVLSAVAMLLGVGLIALSYWKNRRFVLFHYAAMLAVVPTLVTYGWGGTYLLALPLILLEIGRWTSRSRGAWIAAALVMGALIVPAYKPYPASAWGGEAVAHLFHNRYLYVVWLTLAGGIWRHWMDAQRKPASIPALESGEATATR